LECKALTEFVTYNAPTINTQNAFCGVQGGGKVSHINIRDISAAVAKTLTEDGHEGKAYTLTDPVALYSAYVLGSSGAW
jgi:uncharacterized protein YbjT (DUF2867 family)